MAEQSWETLLVELLRFGGDEGSLRKGEPYLVIRANDPARKVEMELSHEDFLDLLDILRYARDVTDDERQEALAKLADVVTRMLGLKLPPNKVQIDLVVAAKELSALPFEAATGRSGRPLVIRARPTVEITRRVRGAFRDHAPRWPARPRVLFAAAAPERQVPTEQHWQKLRQALRPWIEPLDGFPEAIPHEEQILTVLQNASLASIRDVCREARDAPYTHVHVLAHGSETALGMRQKYGLRLHGGHGKRADDVTPDQLTEALSAGGALPVAVSVTACDSGNVGSTIVSGASVAQTIHTKGVPIVIGSQFPLTVAGSIRVVEAFYSSLFAGDDVRDAIHQVRRTLYEERASTGHDWMSLVGYVQLPEGYADRLVDMRLEAAMASLKTGQAWADHLSKHPNTASPETYDSVAEQLRERISSLRRSAALPENSKRQTVIEENRGLLGSANKRLAELLFARSSLGYDVQRLRRKSRQALEEARRWYEQAANDNLSAHWVGVQLLSLETVLDGRISKPWRWHAALEAASTACRKRDEIWAFGSRAELYLLAPYAGEGPHLAEAAQALRDLKARATGPDAYPIESTLRQLRRYTTWWTTANAYFPGATDLVEDAGQVIRKAGIDDSLIPG